MPNRFLVTCLLCMWVYTICAPALSCLCTEDPVLILSLNSNEEEPGEGEKHDGIEEIKALPENLRVPLVPLLVEIVPHLHHLESSLDLVQEVVLPPPEGRQLS